MVASSEAMRRALACLVVLLAGGLLVPASDGHHAAPCTPATFNGFGGPLVAGAPDKARLAAFNLTGGSRIETLAIVSVPYTSDGVRTPNRGDERALTYVVLQNETGVPVMQLGLALMGRDDDPILRQAFSGLPGTSSTGIQFGPHTGGCMSLGFHVSSWLAPGSYRLLVAGGGDQGSHFGAMVDVAGGIGQTSQRPADLFFDDDLACATNHRVSYAAQRVSLLRDCTRNQFAHGEGHLALVTDAGMDALHDVYWQHPGGDTEHVVDHWLVNRTAAGHQSLRVPIYAGAGAADVPECHGFWPCDRAYDVHPAPRADQGIIGLFVDAPAWPPAGG